MKCKECVCCRKGWFLSSPNDYVCIGVKNPFIINNINEECSEYFEYKDKVIKDVSIEKAIEHFKYGISHDIFSEPVTSYAKMAVEALDKQIAKKPVGDLNSVPHYRCPNCNNAVAVYKFDYKYSNCKWCGQKLDWE